ncbi:uncharacterized protein LOC132738374 [Ruditapes philippinarum]|uniref:uncharacterized protein LOC132738374 n=1 Tax=Ruditapes philippinarum TaxID=129788 RepID=UPI00295B137A|nr:uncharacterized protein LOC132738374 [Ruditapes philippinarum]
MNMIRSVSAFEQNSNRRHALQMPHLPDPGKIDSQFANDDKLDFSIRLGSTLSRGFEIGNDRSRRGMLSTLDERSITHPTSMYPSEIEPIKTHSKSNLSRRNSRRGSLAIKPPKVFMDRETALAKMKRVFKMVRIISGVCLALKRYVKQYETKTWSFMEMYLHVKEDLNQLVAFNPHSYARVEPERLKLKKLLLIDPTRRTAHDVKVILALMRDNKSFQDYPCHVQFELARCMTYQSYEARRVVLKLGHRPEAFYIVLSGFVFANVKEVCPSTGKTFMKTVKEMGPGDTFGELALIEKSRRTATIVCKTTVELLVILKDDFDSIIRNPLVKQIDEHVTFCKTMPLFKDFPCDELADNPAYFFYHFFKKGDIVVKDSRESKYIIAVKAGKCNVICMYTEKNKIRKSKRNLKTQKEINAAFPQYDDRRNIMSAHRRPKTDTERLKENICLGLLTGQIDRIRLADHGPDVQRPKSCITLSDFEKKLRPPPLVKSKTLSAFFDSVTTKRKSELMTDEDLMSDITGTFWAKRLQHIRKVKSASKYGHRRMLSARSTSSRASSNPYYTLEKDTYAQLAELGSGAVFGLESLVQKPATCLSLVSEGAECIFISKRLFLSLANIKVLRVVTDMIQTYPSKEFIEEQVQNYRNWQKYKSGLVTDVLNRRRSP